MDKTIRILLTEPQTLPAYWLKAEPYVRRALNYAGGEQDSGDVRDKILRGEMQLWLVLDNGGTCIGAATTEVVRYPRKGILRIVTLSGNSFAEWRDKMLHEMCERARELGLSSLEALGRKGLARKLKPLGFKEIYVALTKEV